MTTLLAVRHADIDLPPAVGDRNPPLNAAGRRRADDLARLVGRAGVGAILTSEADRTQQTAAPTAQLLGLVPQVAPEPDVLAKRLRAGELGDVVLLVGHSNTVPAFVAALGGRPPTIDEREFHNLFVVTVPEVGPATVLHLRYGPVA
jgi:broad specificity phosphatase PhoE